jgi:hypothetical protein
MDTDMGTVVTKEDTMAVATVQMVAVGAITLITSTTTQTDNLD